MGIGFAAGMDCELAEGIVGIPSGLTGAATGPVLCPFLGGQPPVLVGQQLTGALQILEIGTVLFNQTGRGQTQSDTNS